MLIPGRRSVLVLEGVFLMPGASEDLVGVLHWPLAAQIPVRVTECAIIAIVPINTRSALSSVYELGRP